jgi:aerobic C4-dicarboxylate transport protein
MRSIGKGLSGNDKPVVHEKKKFHITLWGQVLLAVVAGIALGSFRPATAIAMQVFGTAFIKLITMLIGLIIFCTVVTSIAGMGDMKKLGRVGLKTRVYFEIVSTLALLAGQVVGNVVQTRAGFNANPAALDASAVANYAGQAKAQGSSDFLWTLRAMR